MKLPIRVPSGANGSMPKGPTLDAAEDEVGLLRLAAATDRTRRRRRRKWRCRAGERKSASVESSELTARVRLVDVDGAVGHVERLARWRRGRRPSGAGTRARRTCSAPITSAGPVLIVLDGGVAQGLRRIAVLRDRGALRRHGLAGLGRSRTHLRAPAAIGERVLLLARARLVGIGHGRSQWRAHGRRLGAAIADRGSGQRPGAPSKPNRIPVAAAQPSKHPTLKLWPATWRSHGTTPHANAKNRPVDPKERRLTVCIGMRGHGRCGVGARLDRPAEL